MSAKTLVYGEVNARGRGARTSLADGHVGDSILGHADLDGMEFIAPKALRRVVTAFLPSASKDAGHPRCVKRWNDRGARRSCPVISKEGNIIPPDL